MCSRESVVLVVEMPRGEPKPERQGCIGCPDPLGVERVYNLLLIDVNGRVLESKTNQDWRSWTSFYFGRVREPVSWVEEGQEFEEALVGPVERASYLYTRIP